MDKKVFKDALKKAFTGKSRTKTGQIGGGALGSLYSPKSGIWDFKTSREMSRASRRGESYGAMRPDQVKTQLGKIRGARAAATVGNVLTAGLINVAILAKATHRGYTGTLKDQLTDKCAQIAASSCHRAEVSEQIMLGKLRFAAGLDAHDTADGFDDNNTRGATPTTEVAWYRWVNSDEGQSVMAQFTA